MRRSVATLGRKPLTRRLVAAVLLIGMAIVTTALRGDPSQRLFDLGINLAVALIALAVLHVRWRARERRTPSARQAEDIFS